MMPNIESEFVFNSFVRRQTIKSHFSHWTFSDEEMFKRIKSAIKNGRVTRGYREGVVLAHINPSDCFTGQVKLKEGDRLVGSFERRRKGESPRKNLMTVREGVRKTQAMGVDVVLYHAHVLAEDGSNETENGWEIVSVNARACPGKEPIHPNTLMHNHFGSDGGTETNMNSEEFEAALRISFEYWKDRAVLAPKE